MLLIRRSLKLLGALSLLCCSSAFAATIIPSTSISDNLNDYAGSSIYEIGGMNIEMDADGNMRVDITTMFGNQNNRHGVGGNGKNIVFGDLLISTTGDANYDYAFKLTDTARLTDYMNPITGVKTVNNGGNLVKIDNTISARQYHGSGASVQSGPVMGSQTGGSLGSGTFIVDTQDGSSGLYDTISFVFNVGNIFANTDQIALSWAMSCYNDAVQGLATLETTITGGGTPVPAPQTLALVMLGLGLLVRQRRKQL